MYCFARYVSVLKVLCLTSASFPTVFSTRGVIRIRSRAVLGSDIVVCWGKVPSFPIVEELDDLGRKLVDEVCESFPLRCCVLVTKAVTRESQIMFPDRIQRRQHVREILEDDTRHC